jgi:hypothetical protein
MRGRLSSHASGPSMDIELTYKTDARYWEAKVPSRLALAELTQSRSNMLASGTGSDSEQPTSRTRQHVH